MDEQRIYVDETEEVNSNDEKNKKILAVLIILLLFSGVYYYYAYYKKVQTPPQPVATTPPQPVVSATTAPVTPTASKVTVAVTPTTTTVKATEKKPLEAKSIIQAQKEELKLKAQQAENNFSLRTGKIILPTQKRNIISFAVTVGGKRDPFYDKTAEASAVGSASSNLRIPSSVSPAGLPFITGVPSNLPSMASFGQAYAGGFVPVADVAEKVVLKGFIGNKAILSYGDDVQTLRANNTFHGVKIVSVNPYSLSVKLKKGNRIYTKQIKDLAEPSYPESSLPKINL